MLYRAVPLFQADCFEAGQVIGCEAAAGFSRISSNGPACAPCATGKAVRKPAQGTQVVFGFGASRPVHSDFLQCGANACS